MTSLALRMPAIRERVWALLGDLAIIGALNVRGKFNRRYREIQLQDGMIAGLDLSFDCNVSAEILAMAENDPVTIDGVVYRFLRRVPPGGDESGLVTLELKR